VDFGPSGRYAGRMFRRPRRQHFRVETMGESSGHCDCCGKKSRCVWGFVYNGEVASAQWETKSERTK
jgi:hypothetical protein